MAMIDGFQDSRESGASCTLSIEYFMHVHPDAELHFAAASRSGA